MSVDSLLRPPLLGLLKCFFRVELRGAEHFKAAGDKVIIAPNHVSYLDPLLLAVFLPEKPAFAMNVFQAQKWYFRWTDKATRIYKLDPSKPLSTKTLISELREGAKVVIFPEGRITTTGGIMKIYGGCKAIAEKTGAAILPVRIDGAEYSFLSLLRHKIRQRRFPKITITLMPPMHVKEGISEQAVYDLMVNAAFAASPTHRPLLAAFLDAYDQHGGSCAATEDMQRSNVNYRQLFTRSFILSAKLSMLLGKTKSAATNVGLMLPTSVGATLSFIALHMLGRTPAMLNFSAGAASVGHACRIACLETIITSRVFIEKAKLEALVEALALQCRILYLEDIRPSVKLKDKLMGLGKALFARRVLGDLIRNTPPDAPAVILFTSGSEGTPKGVALSHANLLANVWQARAVLDLTPSDVLFNALPVFHSFGLTVGTLMPLISGIKTFLYPSPAHYRVIPDLVYDTNASILLGTDTFYNGYAYYAHDYDFFQVRLAVAGAEKLKESTRRLWADRFGVSLMQGYGVTEAAPAVSFNTPLCHRHGSVGRLFPGMQAKLEAVPGIETGGKLLLKGPNIMLGYLKADQPGIIQRQGEWYDTGDIVALDAEGYLFIQGRAKRFAKIGGEMVSLQAVEDLLFTAAPDACHAAIAVDDEHKGEQVVVYTESKNLTRDALLKHAREAGVPELFLPRQIRSMEALPRLGNGKVDYPSLVKAHASYATSTK